MAPQYTGKFEFVDADNFPAYLKAIGLSDEQIEAGKQQTGTSKPVVELSQNGDTYTLNILGLGMKIDFKIGQEFNETIFGQKAKATVTKDGDKFVQTTTFDNGVTSREEREFTDSGLKTTTTWPGGKCVRNYKRI